jgi:hypothetical protein
MEGLLEGLGFKGKIAMYINSWFQYVALRCIRTWRTTKGLMTVTIVAYLYINMGYWANEG